MKTIEGYIDVFIGIYFILGLATFAVFLNTQSHMSLKALAVAVFWPYFLWLEL